MDFDDEGSGFASILTGDSIGFLAGGEKIDASCDDGFDFFVAGELPIAAVGFVYHHDKRRITNHLRLLQLLQPQ